METTNEPPRLTLFLNIIFALVSAVTVANAYWCYPILAVMGVSFGVDSADIGFVATATLIGYVLGLLFIAPVGDMVSSRMVVLVLCSLCTILSVALVFIPWLLLFKLVTFFIGVFTVVPQILVPLSAILAEKDQKGRAVGIVVSGIMLGIVVTRAISGLVAYYFNWRSVYVLASILNFIVTVLMYFFLPSVPPRIKISYPTLLISLWTLFRKEVVLQQVSVINGLSQAIFQLFWTNLTFHLAGPVFHMNSFQIGLFGLAGFGGIISTTTSGHLADRFGPYLVVIIGIVVYFTALIILITAGTTIPGIIIGGFLIDFSQQLIYVSNQVRIYAINPISTSRVNSVNMVIAFIGGSIGTAVGTTVYHNYGWVILMVLTICWLSLLAILHFARTPKQAGWVPGWVKGGKWWEDNDKSSIPEDVESHQNGEIAQSSSEKLLEKT